MKYRSKLHMVTYGLIVGVILLFVNLNAYPSSTKKNHVEVELVADVLSIRPGTAITVALRMTMDNGWHTYWKNPGGNIGLPTRISWKLPNGFSVGPIQWPYPEKIITPLIEGEPPMVSYGYDEEILLQVEISTPESLPVGQKVSIEADVKWLACESACIPGSANLKLNLPVSNEIPRPNKHHMIEFANAQIRLPLTESDWKIQGIVRDSRLEIHLKPPIDLSSVAGRIEFYPAEAKTILDYAPQQLIKRDGWTVLEVRLNPELNEIPDRIEGTLISDIGWRGQASEKAWNVDIEIEDKIVIDRTEGEDGVQLTVGLACLFAFIGGAILNLMPCVLPVLSLKVLNFVKKGGEKPAEIRKHGIVFTLGVLVAFWTLAGVLIGVRLAGKSLGWGFQLQSPIFLIILSSILFLLALGLMGVFEIGTTLTSIGSKQSQAGGYFGSFITGAIAVIVATPCTAPFMGYALGFGLTQPPIISILVFTFLGLGLAIPYLVLSFSPGLIRLLPKPGPWMETMKQLMGFPLFATVIWLLWVLGGIAGVDVLCKTLMALLLMGLGAWILGRWATPVRNLLTRRLAVLFALILFSGGLYYACQDITAATTRTVIPEETIWEPYSFEKLAALRKQGLPVFINFTADWCLTCKVNEKVAFTLAVLEKFAEKKVTMMKADFTRHDESISNALVKYGRSGVPLYVLYGRNPNQKPQILPQILTAQAVLDALESIK